MEHITSRPMSQVKLLLNATNLKKKDILTKSDPVCIVSMRENGDLYTELGRTEKISNSSNPRWKTEIEMDFHFEERQHLQFVVYDWDTESLSEAEQDLIGRTECSLGEIMSHQGSAVCKLLSDRSGELFIEGREVQESVEMAVMEFRATNLDNKDTFGKSDPYLVISKEVGSSFEEIFRTEVIKNDLNPHWKPIMIPLLKLRPHRTDVLIKLQCYDWDSKSKSDFIGECTTTLYSLRKGPCQETVFELLNPKKIKGAGYKNSGKLILDSFKIHKERSLLEYIRNGLKLHFTVAVDFTASNGHPSKPDSLHYCDGERDNEYTIAVKTIGGIIEDYSSDKMFLALGFGARVPPTGEVSHEFPLNGNADSPYCSGVDGIISAYHSAVKTVTLFGPTNFAPVVNKVASLSKAMQDGNNYYILLILTDGVISDLEETKKSLIKASQLPMSVVIIGVGTEDFSSMRLLDSDGCGLRHDSFTASRDIVQFVEMKKHIKNGNQVTKFALSKEVLQEIPQQVNSYMQTFELIEN